MSTTRQQIMILHLALPELDSGTIAWAMYDGSKPAEQANQTGDSDTPPYPSVLAAMRDGWNVIQLPVLQAIPAGREHDTGYLPYEYILERKVEVHV